MLHLRAVNPKRILERQLEVLREKRLKLEEADFFLVDEIYSLEHAMVYAPDDYENYVSDLAIKKQHHDQLEKEIETMDRQIQQHLELLHTQVKKATNHFLKPVQVKRKANEYCQKRSTQPLQKPKTTRKRPGQRIRQTIIEGDEVD